MDNLYNNGVPIGQEERQQFLAQQPQQTPANQLGENQQFDEETTQYLETLSPEERQAAIDEINAPMTGEDIAEALKQNADFIPTQDEYLKYVAFNKTHESSIIDGIGEGVEMVLNDLGKAVGAVADHPLKALATAPPSLIEAFAQGTRNLYGMVAQSANPDSVLFGFKNALAGDGSPEGYNQFLEARRFNKHSARLASGEDTLVMDKNVIDHDITLAMSYIADPTLFIPFGTAATAGMKAVGMGEKLVALGGRAAQLRTAVIGGGLKWGIGAPIEFIGGTTRAVIDTAVATGGNVLETATGISAAELRATARMSAVGTTTASALGGHIPVVSSISNAYVAGSAAAGIGEAIGAVGEQMLRQGGKRGFNSFAREALRQTPNLSKHAQGLLKVLDAVDPMFSYGYGIAGGAAHGAAIGGTLGYLSGGEEGLGHGIGAGLALGAVGAGAGRIFADISGGTEMARAEVHGGFVIESQRATKHPNLSATEAILLDGTLKGDRGGALQVIAGLDRIAPDARLVVGNYADQVTMLKSRGLDIDGHKVDPATGKKILDASGKPVEFAAGADAFKGGEGFVMYTDMDATGKRQVTIHINTDAKSKNVLHHELFHAVFAETVMKGMFRDKFAKAVLGEFDANGIRVKGSEVDPKEMRQFVRRELQFTRDSNGNRLSVAEVKKRLAEFDGHLAEYEKAGATTKMNPDSARALDKIVEEFGAHYATQFMKGKSLDYLFHGGELPGIRGMMDRVQNGFLDFWQSNITKQNPTFGDFTKSFDKSFAPDNGKRTLAQRSSAIDYAVQDLIRAAAGKNKGSSNSIDVRTMTPDSRKAFFESSGMDGTKYFFDKNGKPRAVTETQVKMERLAVGKAVHDSLSTLDPKVVAGLVDVDGSFVASSTLGTKFNDTMLAHLVKDGHISQLLADRIKAIQEIVSGKGSNVVSYLYHGESMETQVGPRSPRLYGADVPITSRETIVVGYKISVKKDGSMSLTMKGLDKKVIDARGNTLWADQAVRDLWQGDRNQFDQSFFDYLSNASKASTDISRVESSLIPSLARGDGFGAERRNVMHQFLGMAKRDSATYFNKPLAEIPRGKTSVVFNQSMDLMSPMRSDLPTRFDFNLDNAHSDLSRNFKVSDMDVERTPNGDIFKHASGYKIVNAEGAAKLYNKDGEVIGSFKDKEAASVAMDKAYQAERVEVEKRIERVKESQQKQQQNFKVWDEETLAKGRELGDIFETDAGKAFHTGTELIRQTREEFYSDNFIKLRQSDPETVLNATEAIMSRVEKIAKMKEQMEDAFYASSEKGIKREIQRQELMNVTALLQRYNDIRLAYGRATKGGKRDGQAILDYINTHRRTSTGYDNMAKVFFGEQYDAQFQTGKPVTTVATHGTSSNELLTSKEFDTSKLGSRHMNDKDKVGVFLSGETKTSFGYADPMQGEQGYRQVRAAIKFNNPLVVDYGFNCFDGAKYERIFNTARTGGHDGVIIKNVYDGGSADTVFVVMADKVKDNTAIIDTHIGMDRVDTATRTLLDQDQGSVRYPIQESMPRGKGVRVGSDLGMSWKVADGVARETGFDKFLEGAELSGRLRKGVKSEDFAGRPVVLINYDNSGVWNLIDSSTGEVISTIQGGALHNVISGKINPDKQSAVLASVNAAGLKGIEAVRQKAIKSGKPLTFLLISGNETKSFSHPQVGGAVTSLLAKFLQSKAIDPAEINTLIKAMSEAFSTKSVKNKDGTTSQIRVPQGDLLKPLIGRPAAEQIAFLEKQFFPQDKSTFNNRGETMDRLVQTLATLPSVVKNKDYFQKFFNNPEMKMTGKDFQREFLKLTDEPMTRTMGGKGESLGYGKIVAALEVPQHQTMITKAGGHEGFPMDYRSDAGGKKTTPAVMSVFETPRRITDMISPPHGRDVNPHYISKSGKLRSSSELIMNTTSTFGEGVVRESSHDVRKDNLSRATTKEKTLTGEPKFKVDDLAGEPREGGRTYDIKSEKWKRGFLGRIAEKDPAKVQGMEINYIENKNIIKGQNLVTVALTNKAGQQVGILNATIYNDGTAKIVDTQVPEQFGNRGYSKLMLSEFGERVRSQGVKEVFGEIVDEMGRPDKARKSVFGNSELDLESYSNISTSGHATVSKLSPDMHYKVRDNAYHSALNKTVEDIFTRTVGKDQSINPARLLNLLKSASGGNVGRILTEAKANGLINMLEAGGQKKMPIAEIRKFLTDNEIKVTSNADTLRVDADFGSSMDYISKPWNPSGNRGDNYHTLLLNIAPKYAHGVAGHFDLHSPTGTTGDTIVHARGTVRTDAQGRKVFNVEEIQPQNSNAGVLSPAEKTKAIATHNKLKEITDAHTHEVIKERREAKGRVQAYSSLFDALGTAHDADSIPYYLKRLENWFDTAREDVPDATPALMKEMMKVVDMGIRRYNVSLSGGEQVPVGAKSPAEMLSNLRKYNHNTDGWIPTYYQEAIAMGVEDYAALVHKVGAVDSPYQKKLTANDTFEYPVLIETIKNKQALQKKISDSVKQELKAKFTKEEMPAAYKDELINPEYAKMKQSEIEYSIKKTANDMPLQDFAETTRLMHREIMAKAVELGVDRVTFVQSKDTHPDVQMRNERGAALYDRDIPAMVNGELKKFGTELKPANNIDQSPSIRTSDIHDEHAMLSSNLGYDITSQMAEAVSKSQPTYKVADTAPARAEGTPDLKPFEGKFKVSDVVKSGVAKLDETLGRLAKTENLSPTLRDAMKALKDAVRRQDATDETIVPELREAYDAMVRSVEDQMAGASLTPIDSLKEIHRVLKPLDKKIRQNSERVQKNIKDSYEADMAEGADVESQTTADRRTAARRDMEEGASLESDQVTSEIDRKRGDARLDMEEGAMLESDEATARIGETVQDLNDGADIEANQPRNQNLPPQFPNPAPPVPAGLPSYKPSGTPAFPRPPATPPLPSGKPSGKPAFPRPPATTALPRGSIAPPPPQGTGFASRPLPSNVPAPKPLGKLEGWRGWTLEKGLNGGFWKNAVGWMIVVQADKFKVYNPQKAMMGIYEDLDQAKRRVQRAEPKQ